MHLRRPSRLGAFGVAAVLSFPTLLVASPSDALAVGGVRVSAAERLIALERQAATLRQQVRATTAKVVSVTKAATNKARETAAIVQNITGGGPTTTLAPKAASESAVGVAALGTFTVGQLDRTFVDTSRPTAANGTGAPRQGSRSIATTVLYPTGSPSGMKFPVLVFGHGLGASPKRYLSLLTPIASAGYVVVAPTFPLSNSATPNGATVVDEPQQPGDMRFAMDQVIALAGQPGNPLSGIVDGFRLAAAGHSLGGITTLDYAYGSGYDKRLRATIPISSIMNIFSGARYFTKPMIPMLLIHGDADATVPYALGSVSTFSTAPSPKALLTIRNGNHTFGLGASSAAVTEVGTAVVIAMVDFLDRYVKDDPTGINRLQALATGQPGLLRLDASGL